jgi:hypothetical protein
LVITRPSPGAFDADAPYRLRLLRTRTKRPRDRAAEQRDELAARHSITSSAVASNVSGRCRVDRDARIKRRSTTKKIQTASLGDQEEFSTIKTAHSR